MKKPKRSPFYTTKEAARLLRVQPKTLMNMRWKGDGQEYRKHGGLILYHIRDLLKWSKKSDYCEKQVRAKSSV